MKKIFCGLLLTLIVLTGCSSKSSSTSAAKNDMFYTAGEGMMAYDADFEDEMKIESPNEARSESSTDTVSKIIVNGNMSLETLELDKTLEALKGNIKKFNGYVQSSDSGKNYNGRRYYSATIRIPADKYQEFIASLGENGNIVTYSESISDITTSYYDVQARIDNLIAERERVTEFYKKAETIEELMQIEQRLTDIQYEIDAKSVQIRNWDTLVSYSTLNISISETTVFTETKTSFGERIVESFRNGWVVFTEGLQDLAVWLVGPALWSLITLALFCCLIVFVAKKLSARAKAKKLNKTTTSSDNVIEDEKKGEEVSKDKKTM